MVAKRYCVNYATVTIDNNVEKIDFVELQPDMELSRQTNYYLLQTLRKNFPNDVFYARGNKIYILEKNNEILLEKINTLDDKSLLYTGVQSFSIGPNKEVDIFDKENENFVKSFLGELIATQLRERGYLVKPKGNNAFRAIIPKELLNEGGLEAWPGFEYQFIIEQSEIYVLIDPRYRLNWVHSLKNELDRGQLNSTKLKYERVKDICPIRTCDERTDPYSRCRLNGPGNTVFFREIITESPTENFNVITYLDIIHCPSQILPEQLKTDEDMEFSAYASTNRFGDTLKYPLDRLARIPTIDLLRTHEEAKSLMDKIQPSPEDRLVKSCEYLGLIQNVTINNFPTVQIGEFIEHSERSEKINFFRNYEYTFGEKENASSPFFITKRTPYFIPKVDKLHYISLLSSEIKKNELLNKLFSDEIYEGFGNLLNLEHLEPFEITMNEYAQKKIEHTVIMLLEDEGDLDQYRSLSFQGIEMDNTIQKITLSDLEKNLSHPSKTRAKNHLRNVSLGWLSKTGGTPFIIAHYENSNTHVIGWSTSYKKMPKGKMQYRISLNIYKANGEHVKTVFVTVSKQDYKKILEEQITNVFQSIIEPDLSPNPDIVLLKQGHILKNEKDILGKILSVFSATKIHILGVSEGISRIYKFIERGSTRTQERPDAGISVSLTDNQYILLTTSSHNRTVDDQRTHQAINCSFYEDYPKEEKDEINKILSYLSSSNHGFIRARTKLPSPLHASKKTQEFFGPHQIHNGYFISSEKEFFT